MREDIYVLTLYMCVEEKQISIGTIYIDVIYKLNLTLLHYNKNYFHNI
jgi:hypothetical protein